jgi:hypothetical protein
MTFESATLLFWTRNGNDGLVVCSFPDRLSQKCSASAATVAGPRSGAPYGGVGWGLRGRCRDGSSNLSPSRTGCVREPIRRSRAGWRVERRINSLVRVKLRTDWLGLCAFKLFRDQALCRILDPHHHPHCLRVVRFGGKRRPGRQGCVRGLPGAHRPSDEMGESPGNRLWQLGVSLYLALEFLKAMLDG